MNGLAFAKPAPAIVGSPYFNKHWDKVIVTLHDLDDPLDEFYGRYGIFSEDIEVITPQGVRAIPSGRIKELVFSDSITYVPTKFISVKNYDFEGTHLAGLFEVLAEGKMMLLKSYKISIRDPDYSPALNSGSKDVTVVKESEIFCTLGTELVKVKSKKKLLYFFGEKTELMTVYMKENKLGGSQADLAKAVNYYNSLN